MIIYLGNNSNIGNNNIRQNDTSSFESVRVCAVYDVQSISSSKYVNRIGLGTMDTNSSSATSCYTKYSKRSSDGKTFYFYDTSGIWYQNNRSGVYYYYLAIK